MTHSPAHSAPRHASSRRRRLAPAAAAVTLAAGALAAPALAAAPAATVSGLTSPGGSIVLGSGTDSSVWVSDHLLGFCRVDGGALNQATCNTAAASPGQASAVGNTVFVPDNGAKGAGVWRLTYDPTLRTVGNALLHGSGLGGIRPTATAVSADGSTLFVGAIKDGNIRALPTANRLASAQVVAQTSDRRGVSGLAVNGGTLYIAEGAGISTVPTSARGGQVAVLAANDVIAGPSGVAADSQGIWVTEVGATGESTLLRWSFTGAVDRFGPAGSFATGVSVQTDATGAPVSVRVTDDPSDGAAVQQGHLLTYAAGDPAERNLGNATLPSTGGGGGGGTPPPAQAGTVSAARLADGPSAVRGYVSAGVRWASSSGGFCQVAVPTVCAPLPAGTVPGQPTAFSRAAGWWVVLPDSGTAGGAVRVGLTAAGAPDPSVPAVRLGGGSLKGAMTASAPSGDFVLLGGSGTNIMRQSVTAPATRPATWAKVGAPPTGFARLGSDLLVTNPTGTQVISGIDTCNGRCSGTATPISPSGGAPTAVASDGGSVAFIAAGGAVERFDLGSAGGHDGGFVRTWDNGGVQQALGSVTGLLVDGTTLVLGDGARTYTAPTS